MADFNRINDLDLVLQMDDSIDNALAARQDVQAAVDHTTESEWVATRSRHQTELNHLPAIARLNELLAIG